MCCPWSGSGAASFVLTHDSTRNSLSPVRRCGSTDCWGGVVGTGLRPGTMVVPLYVNGGLIQLYDVPASGVISQGFDFSCGSDYGPVYAPAITASGDHIAADTVRTPCP